MSFIALLIKCNSNYNYNSNMNVSMAMCMILILVAMILNLVHGQNTLDCECGQEQLNQNAQGGQFPWIVSIMSPIGHCTGTLINDRYILTAASCFNDKTNNQNINLIDKSRITIAINAKSKTDHGLNNQAVSEVKVHHKFNQDRYQSNLRLQSEIGNDLMLLKLQNPIKFNLQFKHNFNPICLASFSDSDKLFAIGFNSQTSYLRSFQVQEIDPVICNQHMFDKTRKLINTRNILCGQGSFLTPSDIGGPLITRSAGHTYQLAVSSSSAHSNSNNAHSMLYDSYELIQPHILWIQENTKDANWCRAPMQALQPPIKKITYKALPAVIPVLPPTILPIMTPMGPGFRYQMRPKLVPYTWRMHSSTIPKSKMKVSDNIDDEIDIIPDINTDCECGIENIDTRIINGRIISSSRYPWIVSIISSNDNLKFHLCGGTLITKLHILTAAHCLYNYRDISKLIVTLDADNRQDRFENPRLQVESMTLHPDYVHGPSTNDVAIIKLVDPVENAMPICLPNQDILDYDLDNNLFALGWGMTSNGVQPNGQVNLLQGNYLQEVNIKLADTNICAKHYGNIVDLNKDMCAGGSTGGTCAGDSGGPLATRKNGRVIQIAITSFGSFDCGVRSNSPNVYEKTYAHIAWINDNTVVDDSICSGG